MATEEVNKPQSLPQYSEMILAAITSLNEENGSSKSSISKHIESTCGEVSSTHETLLSDHLNQMKESGELVMVKNNYMLPNPSVPLKRGRGRPPKQKVPLESDAIVGPPKTKVTEAVAVGSDGEVRRGRGRPPKKARAEPVVKSTGPPRPRGRPPKVKPAVGLD